MKEELRKMEVAGVISRVDEPTEWCAGMVVAPKKNGSGIWIKATLHEIAGNASRNSRRETSTPRRHGPATRGRTCEGPEKDGNRTNFIRI